MCTPAQCRYLSQCTHLVIAVTPKGTIRSVGLHNSLVLGHDPTTLAGKPLSGLVAPDHRAHLARAFDQCRSMPAVWQELVFVTADGLPEPMLCCFQRLTGGDFPRGGIVITGLRLISLKEEVRAEAASLLGQLAFRCHGPAHRLMQAVEAILAESPRSKVAKRCREELDALLDALGQSTIWPKELRPERPVDVVRVLQGAMRLLDADCAGERLKVTLRPECSSAWANVPPEGLVFVLLHLVSNAREAAASVEKPRLFIDVIADGDRLDIEFHDNGPGLDRDHMQCVFAPFFTTRGGKDGHTGMGLATCRELVRFMGGRMRMQSSPEHGTTVVVTLPAAPAPQ